MRFTRHHENLLHNGESFHSLTNAESAVDIMTPWGSLA